MAGSEIRTPKHTTYVDENKPVEIATAFPNMGPVTHPPTKTPTPVPKPVFGVANKPRNGLSSLESAKKKQTEAPTFGAGSGYAFTFQPSEGFGKTIAEIAKNNDISEIATSVLKGSDPKYDQHEEEEAIFSKDSSTASKKTGKDVETHDTSTSFSPMNDVVFDGFSLQPRMNKELDSYSTPSRVQSRSISTVPKGRAILREDTVDTSQRSSCVSPHNTPKKALARFPATAHLPSGEKSNKRLKADIHLLETTYSYHASRKHSFRKAVSFTSSPTFISLVSGEGESKTTYNVHENLAMFHSGYIKSIIEAHARKSKPLKQLNCLNFPDVEQQTMGLFVHYMYTYTIEDQPGTITHATEEGQLETNDPIPLVKLYLFALRCKVPVLQNVMIFRIITILSRSSEENIRLASHLVFKPSPFYQTSPLHDLLVDQVAFSCRYETESTVYEDMLGLLPSKMICLIAARLRMAMDNISEAMADQRLLIRVSNYMCEEE